MKQSFLPFYFTVFFVCYFLVSCTKEYSYEGSSGAQYTIEKTAGVCTPIEIEGTYIEGKSTDSLNIIRVNVDVGVVGTYYIFTNTVNGISFSATGSFSDTGRQVVTLYCSGTPLSAGTFPAEISGVDGCSFTLLVNKKAPSSYLLTSLSGDCSNVSISGQYQQNIKTTDADSVVLYVNVTTLGTYHITTSNSHNFSFSDSGFFSKTGLQSVTLHAIGTPDIQGPVLFNVIADSSQCAFIVPVDPGLPQSVYVLQSSVGIGNIDYCTPHILEGNYISGTVLNSSNTITISVYVQNTGYYSIYTGKQNGISFVSTGQFSTTGEQNITLQGSGTPLAPGDFIFYPKIIGPAPLGGETCGFEVQVQ